MKINQTKNHLQINSIISKLSQWTKISMMFSSVCLLLSIMLLLIYRQEIGNADSIPGAIIWYSIIIAFYSVLVSLITFIIFAIYYRSKNQNFWQLIKREIMLLTLTIVLILILSFISYIMNRINFQ